VPEHPEPLVFRGCGPHLGGFAPWVGEPHERALSNWWLADVLVDRVTVSRCRFVVRGTNTHAGHTGAAEVPCALAAGARVGIRPRLRHRSQSTSRMLWMRRVRQSHHRIAWWMVAQRAESAHRREPSRAPDHHAGDGRHARVWPRPTLRGDGWAAGTPLFVAEPTPCCQEVFGAGDGFLQVSGSIARLPFSRAATSLPVTVAWLVAVTPPWRVGRFWLSLADSAEDVATM